MADLEELVNYAIIVAVAAALVLMVTGRFFDLSIERQTSVQTRSTINLLQDIVTESSLVMTDFSGNKMKLMFEKEKFDATTNLDLIDCCDSVQYDYKFSIGQQKESGTVAEPLGKVWSNYREVGEPFTLEDSCYTSFGLGNRIAASVPANVCYGSQINCDPVAAYIETYHTPLAEISYWITQACESGFDLSKRIPLADDDYNDVVGNLVVDNENKQICLKGNCRRFYCKIPEIKVEFDDSLTAEIPWSIPSKSCSFVSVVRKDNEIKIVQRLGG